MNIENSENKKKVKKKIKEISKLSTDNYNSKGSNYSSEWNIIYNDLVEIASFIYLEYTGISDYVAKICFDKQRYFYYKVCTDNYTVFNNPITSEQKEYLISNLDHMGCATFME